MKFELVASIVVYKSDGDALAAAIDSFLKHPLNSALFVVDNSPTPTRLPMKDPRLHYIFNEGSNLGFGAAHNLVITSHIQETPYWLVLNPDVRFATPLLSELIERMNERKEIGLSIPKVLNRDGSIQFVNKTYPRPMDFFVRRFGSFIPFLESWYEPRMKEFEMRKFYKQSEFECPYVSGCFMFLRTELLKKAGFFDEKFFLYLEDADLSHRMSEVGKNMVFTDLSIVHEWQRGPYRDWKLTKINLESAAYYFKKWRKLRRR